LHNDDDDDDDDAQDLKLKFPRNELLSFYCFLHHRPTKRMNERTSEPKEPKKSKVNWNKCNGTKKEEQNGKENRKLAENDSAEVKRCFRLMAWEEEEKEAELHLLTLKFSLFNSPSILISQLRLRLF